MHAQRALEAAPDEVDRMGRTRGHDGVHGVLAQVFLQETDRRAHPADPGIGDEAVAPDPEGEALLPVLLLRVDGVDFLPLLAPGQPPVDGVRLQDAGLNHLGAGGDVREQALVPCQLLRILRGIDDRLPALLRQVLAEFHPALDPRTAGRGPIIRNDQQALHRL